MRFRLKFRILGLEEINLSILVRYRQTYVKFPFYLMEKEMRGFLVIQTRQLLPILVSLFQDAVLSVFPVLG